MTQYCIIKQRRSGYVSMLLRRVPGVGMSGIECYTAFVYADPMFR